VSGAILRENVETHGIAARKTTGVIEVCEVRLLVLIDARFSPPC
jgi:hypothetical protein